MKYNIKWVSSPNFRKGRNEYKPIAIVNHITAGAFPGCLNWLTNSQAQASSTYLINRNGEIYQLVKDEDMHWANGGINKPNWSLLKSGVNPNNYTISIEHEGYGSNGGDGNLTEKQYQATLWLHKKIIEKWNIPINRDTIIGHYRIDSVNRPNCPGKAFPWDRLFSDLLQQNNPKIIIDNQTIEGIIYENSSYCPTRAFGEALNLPVYWDSKTGNVTIGGILVETINLNGTSYSKIRPLAETLDYMVDWDNNTKTATIYKNNN